MNQLALVIIQMDPNHHMGDGWLTVGWIFWVLVILLLFTLIWFLFKKGKDPESSPSESQKTAKEILDERYARGEIDDEEYQRRKKELREK